MHKWTRLFACAAMCLSASCLPTQAQSTDDRALDNMKTMGSMAGLMVRCLGDHSGIEKIGRLAMKFPANVRPFVAARLNDAATMSMNASAIFFEGNWQEIDCSKMDPPSFREGFNLWMKKFGIE